MAYKTERTATVLADLAAGPLTTITRKLSAAADQIPRGETFNQDAELVGRAIEATRQLVDALMPAEWAAHRTAKPKA